MIQQCRADGTPKLSARLRTQVLRKERKPRKRTRVNPVGYRTDYDAPWPSMLKRPAFYVPVNLDPKLFELGEWQFVAYLLNLIRWKWICWQGDEDGYVHLKREYLRLIIPDDVLDSILIRLVELGVIRHSKLFTQKAASQRYLINPEYQTACRIECQSIPLAKRIDKVYQQTKLLPVHRKLNHWLAKVEFDVELAEQIVPTMTPDPDSQMDVVEYRQLIREMYRTLANGDARIDSVDRFGRVHSPISRLPKELRCCLSIDAQPLVALDLANSQPLIAGIVAASYFKDRATAQRIRDRVFRDGGHPYRRRMPELVSTDRPDLAEYIALCETGQIYEFLMQPGDTRDKIKVAFLTALYSKNRIKTPLKNNLAQRFPSIAKMFTELKKTNHAHAAHIMQNVESTIFIHGICSSLFNTFPHVPIMSLHDSILTTAVNSKYVEQHLNQFFQSLGIKPTIHIDQPRT